MASSEIYSTINPDRRKFEAKLLSALYSITDEIASESAAELISLIDTDSGSPSGPAPSGSVRVISDKNTLVNSLKKEMPRVAGELSARLRAQYRRQDAKAKAIRFSEDEISAHLASYTPTATVEEVEVQEYPMVDIKIEVEGLFEGFRGVTSAEHGKERFVATLGLMIELQENGIWDVVFAGLRPGVWK